jgi:hypothetical protein
MLNDRVVPLSQCLSQLRLRALLPSHINQTKSEQCTSFGELARCRTSGEVRLDDADAVNP